MSTGLTTTTQGSLFSQEELDVFFDEDVARIGTHTYTLERQTPERIEQIAGLIGRGWPVREIAKFMRCSDHLVTKVAMTHPALVATQKERTGQKMLAASAVFLDRAIEDIDKMKPFERVLAAGITAQRGAEMGAQAMPSTVVVVAQADSDYSRRVQELVASAHAAVADVAKSLSSNGADAVRAQMHTLGPVVDVAEASLVEVDAGAQEGGGGSSGARGDGEARDVAGGVFSTKAP